MSLNRPFFQMTLPLVGLEEAIQEDTHLTMEEINARSTTALAGLASLRIKDPNSGVERQPQWWGLFQELRDGGWPWRVAVYIAWAAQPRRNRWPVTQEELVP